MPGFQGSAARPFRLQAVCLPFIALCLWIIPSPGKGQAQLDPDSLRQKMSWFADAKLGIFIHWGIYSVQGVDESWSFHNRKMTHRAYMDQIHRFTASAYDPESWAQLIQASGARYAVITTKHHDGVALFPTRAHSLSIPAQAPAGRDLIAPFFEALRRRGLKCGAYFSLLDWSHPDYPGFLRDSSRYRIQDEPARWEAFKRFNFTQIGELCDAYRPDLFWFDGDWEHSAGEWDAKGIRRLILGKNPGAILNGRLQGYGDYETPEQNIPVDRPSWPWWELCMTSNNNWGWQPQDSAWKTPYEIITLFADVISMGGNLLLDIGPREDGTIPEAQRALLDTLGTWCRKHDPAIYGTVPGLPYGHFHGASTLSHDSTTLFLFVPGSGLDNVVIKGLKNRVRSAYVVGHQTKLEPKVVGKISWSPVPGRLFVEIPAALKDPYLTVLALELDGKLQLYRGKGGL